MGYPKPFRWWVENVLPLVYDGSLSYYEVLSKVTEYINGLTADMSEVKTEIENIDAIIETLDPERIETLLTEVDTLATAVSGMEGRVGTLEDDNEDNKNDINTLNSQVNTLESNVSTLDTNVDNLGGRLGNVEEQVSNYNERITDAENLAQTASSNTAALGIRVDDAEAEVDNIGDKVDNYGGAIAESEEWFTATRSYAVYDLVFVGGTLYEVISNIAAGDSLTIGSNIKAVSISKNNREIKNAIGEIETNVSTLNNNVEQNTEDIESLEINVGELMDSVFTDSAVDFSTADVVNRIIAASSGLWSSTGTSYLIPIKSAKKITITSSTTRDCIVAILKSNDTTLNTAPDYATGCTRDSVTRNTTRTLDIPFDGKYIAIMKTAGSNDYTPNSAIIRTVNFDQTEPVSMVATEQIASGKYFLIGSSLYKSTTTIPSGDIVKPGTNCIETNVADALNALNA